MLAKFFGILDLLAWLSLVLFQLGLFKNILFVFALYLLIKGFLLFPDLISLLDGVTGVFFLLAFFGIFSTLTWILFIFLMQKSVFSLFL